MNVEKIATYIQVSHELIVDSLPFTTMTMSDGDKAATYLKHGQSVTLGRYDHNPAYAAEEPERGLWDFGWPIYLDYDDADDR